MCEDGRWLLSSFLWSPDCFRELLPCVGIMCWHFAGPMVPVPLRSTEKDTQVAWEQSLGQAAAFPCRDWRHPGLHSGDRRAMWCFCVSGKTAGLTVSGELAPTGQIEGLGIIEGFLPLPHLSAWAGLWCSAFSPVKLGVALCSP